MSLYADYVRERTNSQIIESDLGFCVYEVLSKDIIYISEIYVVPAERKGKVASQFADIVCNYAKSIGCKILLGSIDPQSKGAETSVKVLNGYGMKMSHIENNLLFFKKDL